jgi:hypothetical protein
MMGNSTEQSFLEEDLSLNDSSIQNPNGTDKESE